MRSTERGLGLSRIRPSRRWTLGLALFFQVFAACKDGEAASDSGEAVDTAAKPDPNDPAAIEAWMHLETRDFPLLIWAAQNIQVDYHAPERFDVPSQIESATKALARELPDFFADNGPGFVEARLGEARQRFEIPAGLELREGAERLEAILVWIRDQRKLEGEALHAIEYAALNGYLAPLDPHTVLLTPEEHAELGVKTKGRFGGVGIRVYEGQRRIVVDEVLTDSPAQKAGMEAGDVILKIDGQATVNMPIIEARELLRGPEGTKVKVQVRRGTKKLVLEITRGVIRIESVEATRLPGNVAYLKISTFQEDTGAKVGEFLASMGETAPLEGLILDLRGNSGGLLTQATALLDHIVAQGELVIVRSAAGRESQEAQAQMQLGAKVPVLALIDENSASAAEIVAGGVAALDRGVVLGRASFGKGTVQMLRPSEPYGRELALKLTVAEYLVAEETRIQSRGVRPDLRLLPAMLQEIPGVASLYDEERFARARERAITSQLPSAKHDPPPVPRGDTIDLRYLVRSVELEEGEPPPLRDPEIRIAHEVVRGLAGAGARDAALDGLAKVGAEIVAREDEAIGAAMAALWGGRGERWGREAPAPLEGQLELTARRLDEGAAQAGEPFTVEVEVHNRGETPIDRVRIISDCGQDELDGIEYVFGRLEPGERKSQTLNLVMMAWHSDLHDRLRFDAYAGEPRESPLAQVDVGFDIVAQPRPQLGYEMWIVDDPEADAPPRPPGDPRFDDEPFVLSGNGDGRIQAGERVLLAFEVHNRGEGPSAASFVRVRNLSGKLALLEEGELSLGSIAPGKRARGSIGLTVGPGAPEGGSLDFNLLVGDGVLRERVDEELSIPLAAAGEGEPWRPVPPREDYIPRVLGPHIEFEGLSTVVPGGKLTVRGHAEHPRRVEDLVVWVQGPAGPLTDTKVAYLHQEAEAADAQGRLDFETALELEPGPNRIRVIARDADGIEGRADAWVFVPESEAQK